MEIENSCSFCRKILSDECDDDVGAKSTTGATICMKCACDVLVAGYELGLRFPALQNALVGVFGITVEAEESMIAGQSKKLAQRYQKRLLRAREPKPTPDESKTVLFELRMSLYTKKKVEALAKEASLTSAEWIRHAIYLAFQKTKAEEVPESESESES